MVSKLFSAVLLAALVSGCATLTRGTSEEVRIEVDPPDAAVATSLNHACVGPCRISVSRKAEFTVTASKPGYVPASIAVTTGMEGAGTVGLAGNLIIGGIGGLVVDAASGATLSHRPNPVLIALRPVDPRNPKTPPGNLAALEARIAAEKPATKKPAPGS